MADETPSRVPELLIRWGGAVVVIAAAVLSTVVGLFLVPLKVSGGYLPVSAVIAVAANAGLPLLALWWTRLRSVALVPGAVWFVLVLLAAQPNASGDAVLANIWPSTVYMLCGAATIALTAYLVVSGSLRRTGSAKS
ncbi:hypothetical protein LX16_5107 [Stackebrandtia albiflava]|uniref:Uncharacterized protein n=1 Tax=Stackebrandtia albiflava TaxID=406432 RepID=A0A562UPS3_9ACTN|nr:DUF6113 family protein [Stackebrandtia albiflava]TWJ07621.1 hypothetical protein LX16_5107 [Stackebrandtia albiflava]